MKKILFTLLACAPLLCAAAGKSNSSTMQVSFTVLGACTVQSAGHAADVNCTTGTSYQLQTTQTASVPAAAAPSSNSAQAKGQPVVVYF